MSDASDIPADSVADARRIDEICDAFELAWKASDGPSVEEFLGQGVEADRQKLLRELVPIDVTYRLIRGEQPLVADYVPRFGGLDAAWVEQLISQQTFAPTAAFQPLFMLDVLIAGRYLLKQKLGEGGMGEVWVAKQTEPVKRNVAIKLIKAGMDSHAVLARFEAERQALALMEHPNIARVLDGGITASGQPFFVMELVNGLPLNKFCDEAKLTLQQRLELFVPICQAVQHAHHKGIVHRDLKPSNILVMLIDSRPVPKVIDFGVAKATAGKLTDESLETQFGAVVGTLEYMSPEQAGYSGADIDTRADIYSLGVVLYELLTGLRPIDAQRLKQAAYTEMIRIIKEDEPSKPSTRLSTDESLPSLAALRQTEPRKLMAILRGELDWVVMKCLEKDRNRRYETASGLARDIERYLADDPVEARPTSVTYRLSKFLLRNKGPVLAASLLLLALVGGIVGTTWGMVRAEQQRVLAEQQRGLAERAVVEERQAKEAEAEQRNRADVEAVRANAKAEEALENANLERKQRELADTATKISRRHLYAANMSIIQLAWESSRVSTMLDLLNRQRPPPGEKDLRGFEWHYWNRLCHSYLLELIGHKAVTSVTYSPDGKRLASGSWDKTIKVWDAATGNELLTLKGHTGYVESVAFSPDGTRLASASDDQTVKVWDVATRAELFTLKGHTNAVLSVAFSPDGQRVASASRDTTVKLWDSATGDELLALKGETGAVVYSVAFSPDGTRLASAGTGALNIQNRTISGEVRIWNAVTGQQLFTLKGHTDSVTSVAFSPDGKHLASGSVDTTVKLWDATAGLELRTLRGHTNHVQNVAFSRDGKRLASASWDMTVKVWEAATGQELSTLKGHTGYINSVAFSPSGKRVASASIDSTVKVWDSAPNQEPFKLRGNGVKFPALAVAFSPDGTRLAAAGGTINVWDTATGKELPALPVPACRFNSVAFSPDGKRLAAAGLVLDSSKLTGADMADILKRLRSPGIDLSGLQPIMPLGNTPEIRVWDTITGQSLFTLKGEKGEITSAMFSPDGKWLAAASGNPKLTGPGDVLGIPGEVKVWDANTGNESLTLKGHTGYVTNVAFSPDGKRLASASRDNTVKVWDAVTGQELFTLKGHTFWVTSVAFSPDSMRLASASFGDTTKIWDAATGDELLTLMGRNGAVTSVVFSPEGDRLATATSDMVNVWDAATGQELLTLNGHNGQVNCLAFSPDGQRLVSASWDGTVKLWDATPRDEADRHISASAATTRN